MKVIRIPGLSWPIPKGLYHSAQRWTAGAKGVVLRWENVAGRPSTLKAVPSGLWQRLQVRDVGNIAAVFLAVEPVDVVIAHKLSLSVGAAVS